jgi:hypothetical protein
MSDVISLLHVFLIWLFLTSAGISDPSFILQNVLPIIFCFFSFKCLTFFSELFLMIFHLLKHDRNIALAFFSESFFELSGLLFSFWEKLELRVQPLSIVLLYNLWSDFFTLKFLLTILNTLTFASFLFNLNSLIKFFI